MMPFGCLFILSRLQPQAMADQGINRYLDNSVGDLLSLKGRTIVITGGARGLGLAFALAIAEVGGNVAVLDAAAEPHEHFYKIQKEHNVKMQFYQ